MFVTGSLEAGQSIMAMAGCAVRPVVLCLAGNHPSVVAADAELRRAAKGVVWGALANCGQNCGSVQRVFVVEQAASLFVEYLLQEVDSITIGDPLETGVDLGPVHTPERRESVHRAVTEAVNGGARIVRGGTIPAAPGYFYPPTVLLDPPLDCRLMREETPGPVIPIVMTRSLERALMLANDTDYALTASGWTTGTQTAERMMDGLHAGVVTINDVLYSYGEPASTWSGYRKSGMGQNHGVPGLREMSRQRFVSYDPVGNEAPLFAFPYDASGRDLVEASCDFLNRSGLFRKLLAFARLIRIPRFRRRATLRGILGAGRRHV